MRVRSFILAILALHLLGPAALAQSKAPLPAAKHFTLGALDVWALHDNASAVPNNNEVFGVGLDPAAVADVLRKAGAQQTDRIPLEVNDLLIREPHRLILVDTGYHGVILKSLALAGFKPADVTDILITHSHGDHTGGLVADGHSVFARAVIRMSAKEWAYMQKQPDARAIAAVIAPQVRTFEPGSAVLPAITSVALYGHTPGHTGYRIESNGRSLFDIGDLAHSSIVSLAKPGWRNGFDGDQSEAASLRQREFARLAASQQLIFAGHFPFPDIGRIVKAGDGYRFEPVSGNKL